MFSCRVAAGYCHPCQRADGLSAHCFGFSDSGDQAASVKGRAAAYRLVYRCAIRIEQEAALLARNVAFFMRERVLQFLESKGNTAQFVGSVGDAFSAICCLQIFRFTSSKPSKSAIASDEKFIRLRTNSFVRYCLKKRRFCIRRSNHDADL